MPTDEERFATMQGKYPETSPVHLAMAVGTFDTQERGSRFTLNNVHPNLDLGGGLGTGDIFPATEPVELSEPAIEGEQTGGDEDGAPDQAPESDAPAVQVQAGVAEGEGTAPALDGTEGAAEPADGPTEAPTLTADQLPTDWESLPIAELRDLATRLGVEFSPQSPKVGIVGRIRSQIAG